MKKTILTILINFIFFNTAHAVEFSEISFKDKNEDWIEISLNSPLNNEISINEDSTLFKVLPQEIMNKKFILIHFKAPEEKRVEDNTTLHLYTTKKGLTQTNEQLTIEYQEQIWDAICWENNKPTKEEQKDFQNLQKLHPIKCIKSENVSKNQSISKINGEWLITAQPTKNQTNYLQNPNLSNNIQITEIFANPKGKDSNQDWIELYNKSDKKINIGNWQIKINKTIHSIPNPTIIEPKNHLSIPLSLPNKSSTIQLSDHQNQKIVTIKYPTPKEGLSFAKTQNLPSWSFTSPTKNLPNKKILKLNGTILIPPQNNNFTILANSKEQKITYQSPQETLLTTLTQKNKSGTFITTEDYQLISLEIANSDNPKENKPANHTSYITITVCLILLYIIPKFTKTL